MAVNTKMPLTNTADGYLCEGTDIRGGYFVIDEKANIPSTIAQEGSLCYCQGNDTFYIYNGTDWVVKEFGTKVEASSTLGDGNIKINGDAVNVYSHLTTSGNKHIPSGGENGQILRWSEDGTAVWEKETVTSVNGQTGDVTLDIPSDYVTEADLLDSNVKLSGPYTLTKDFGYYKLDGAASKEFGDATWSLRQFLQGAFAEENTTVFNSSPSFGITIWGDTSGEVGTTVTPTVSWDNSTGEFKWGTIGADGKPDYTNKSTGIEYTNGTISATSGTLNAIITFTDDAQTLAVKGSSTRSAVTKHPISNIGNDLYDEYLASEYKSNMTNNDVTASKTFKGYRKMFVGYLTEATTTFDSGTVRKFVKQGKASRGEQYYTVPSGTKQIVVAYPASLTSNSSVTPTFKYESLGQWFTETNIVKHSSVQVDGASADTGTTYYVYSYTHTGTFASDMTYKIKI